MVTKNKQELNKNELDLVFQSMGDAVFAVDKDLKITLFNKQAAKLSGYSAEKAIGQHFCKIVKFISEKDGSDLCNLLFEKLETVSIKNNALLVTKNKKKIVISGDINWLKDQKGKVIGNVVVFRDVTAQREVEKMRSDFLSIAFHQLRAPLTGMRWFIELFREEGLEKMNKSQVDYLAQISKSSDQMVHLLDNLLNVSHIETGRKFTIKKTAVSLDPLLKVVTSTMNPLAEKANIKIIVKQTSDCYKKFMADKEKLLQVFDILLNNSIKYSPKKSKIIISCKKDGENVVFGIKDFGYGIPEKQKKKIFEKFFRADNILSKEIGGSGLGLYIAKSIVEAQGGKMWFKSKENKGTVFFFSIPKNVEKK